MLRFFKDLKLKERYKFGIDTSQIDNDKTIIQVYDGENIIGTFDASNMKSSDIKHHIDYIICKEKKVKLIDKVKGWFYYRFHQRNCLMCRNYAYSDKKHCCIWNLEILSECDESGKAINPQEIYKNCRFCNDYEECVEQRRFANIKNWLKTGNKLK